MSDEARADALAEAESLRYGGPAGSGTQGFTWPKILVAAALLIALATIAYVVLMPTTYVGDARWGANYSTITLVGDKTTLTVDDSTVITDSGGQSLNLEFMRDPLYPLQTSVFTASVTYRGGIAWRIEEQ
jgi:hypothetical protein